MRPGTAVGPAQRRASRAPATAIDDYDEPLPFDRGRLPAVAVRPTSAMRTAAPSAWPGASRPRLPPDPRAVADQPAADHVAFDMFEGDFTHQADACAFEVLLRRFRIDDKAVRRAAEVVHDIDLKSEAYTAAANAWTSGCRGFPSNDPTCGWKSVATKNRCSASSIASTPASSARAPMVSPRATSGST